MFSIYAQILFKLYSIKIASILYIPTCNDIRLNKTEAILYHQAAIQTTIYRRLLCWNKQRLGHQPSARKYNFLSQNIRIDLPTNSQVVSAEAGHFDAAVWAHNVLAHITKNCN